MTGSSPRSAARSTWENFECILWTGYINKKGYGVKNVHQGGRHTTRLAHTHVWIEANGPVPEGHEIDHLCSVRACIQLEHLEPVTHVENVRRSATAKVTAELVEYIRASDRTHAELARELGLTYWHVWDIRKGRIWRIST